MRRDQLAVPADVVSEVGAGEGSAAAIDAVVAMLPAGVAETP